MSEEIKTKNSFVIKKVTPNDVFFTLSPLSNSALRREIFLTKRQPNQNLPLDWALGIFINDALYRMYKQGTFTFDDNKALVRAAIDAGVYFDEALDFTPASEDQTLKIFEILKKGSRPEILKIIEQYGNETVKTVAITKANDLSVGVISLLENIFKIQLTMDGSN